MSQSAKDILRLSSQSTEAFCRYIMPDVFFAPFSPVHQRAVAFLDGPGQRKNLVGTRSLGKTSLTLMGYCGRHILFRKSRFILYVSSSFRLAVKKTENLRRELLSNPMIRKYRDCFGEVKMSAANVEGVEQEFAKDGWVAFGHSLVMPWGAHQPVRGLVWGSYRPDLILLDDVQDMKLMENSEIRQDDYEWVRGDVEKAVSLYKTDYKLIHTDTVKHVDGNTERLARLPNWKTERFPVVEMVGEDKVRSLIPGIRSDEDMQQEYDSHLTDGTLDVFYREFLCLPYAQGGQVFSREHFQYFDEEDLKAQIDGGLELESVVLIDPARTLGDKTCESAVIGVSVDRLKPAIYVRKSITERVMPERLMDIAVEVAESIDASIIAVETNGLGAWGSYPFETRFAQLGGKFIFRELRPKGKKQDRIRALLPFYRRGEVYHEKRSCANLETQLLGVSNSRRGSESGLVDAADAFSYIVPVLDGGDSFWEGSGAVAPPRAVLESELRRIFRGRNIREVNASYGVC